MRLFALILARDEAHNLIDCVSSLRTLTDDIVVFDTGSSDQTAELARSIGVTCRALPWRDHFAEARNAALAHLSAADWVLVLDADERLSASSVTALRRALDDAEEGTDVLHLEVRTYTDDVEQLGFTGMPQRQPWQQGSAGYVTTAEPRLLRPQRGLQYVGRVGEHLCDARGVPLAGATRTHGLVHHLREESCIERHRRRQRQRLSLALRAFLEDGDAVSAALLGATLNEQGRWKAALTYLREAESLDSAGVGVHMQAGVARLHLGLPDGARASFERAWELLPEHPEIAAWWARALLAADSDLDWAEALLDGALVEAPELDLAVVLMAQVQRRRGSLDDARAWLQTILEHNPVHPLALKELGAVHLLMGEARLAEEHLRQALRMRPRDAELLNNLGCALERQGYWDEALSTFSQALERSGNEPRVLRNRALTQAACGRLPQLCDDVHAMLLHSDSPRDEYLTVRERLLEGGWIDALRVLEQRARTSGWGLEAGHLLEEEAAETLEAV